MTTTTERHYVTVTPDASRATVRWYVASRRGCIIERKPLDAPYPDQVGARAEAQAMYPDKIVVMTGEPIPPPPDEPSVADELAARIAANRANRAAGRAPAGREFVGAR